MPKTKSDAPRLSASLEDYLEAIYLIVAEKQAARVTDIARHKGVTTPSATAALQALAERALVNYAPYDIVTLTDEGARLARGVVRRHAALLELFERVLAVDPAEAENAACRMEHAMPREVLDRFVKFVASCPDGGYA